METRLEFSLFWCNPSTFLCKWSCFYANSFSSSRISKRNNGGLNQNKVNPSLTFTRRLWLWAHNWKMVYSLFIYHENEICCLFTRIQVWKGKSLLEWQEGGQCKSKSKQRYSTANICYNRQSRIMFLWNLKIKKKNVRSSPVQKKQSKNRPTKLA